MQENEQTSIGEQYYLLPLFLACSTRNWQRRVVGNLALMLTRKCHGPFNVLAKFGTWRGVGLDPRSDRVLVGVFTYMYVFLSLGTDLRHLSAINLSLGVNVFLFHSVCGDSICFSVIFICATIETGATADTLSQKEAGIGRGGEGVSRERVQGLAWAALFVCPFHWESEHRWQWTCSSVSQQRTYVSNSPLQHNYLCILVSLHLKTGSTRVWQVHLWEFEIWDGL